MLNVSLQYKHVIFFSQLKRHLITKCDNVSTKPCVTTIKTLLQALKSFVAHVYFIHISYQI